MLKILKNIVLSEIKTHNKGHMGHDAVFMKCETKQN